MEAETLSVECEVCWEDLEIHLAPVEEAREVITGTLKWFRFSDDGGFEVGPGVHGGGLSCGQGVWGRHSHHWW